MKYWQYPVLALLALLLWSCGSAPAPETVAPEAPEAVAEEAPAEPETIEITVWKVAEEIYRYADGTIDGRALYVYDEEGHLREMARFGADGEVDYSVVHIVEDGLDVRQERYQEGNLISYTVNEFGPDGLVVRSTQFNPDDEPQSITEFAYDDDGRIVRRISREGNTAITMETEYVYGAAGVETVRYLTPRGDLDGFTEYSYENGRMVAERTFYPDGEQEKALEYIWANDRVQSVRYFVGTRPDKTVTYVYDADGNVGMEEFANSRGRVYESVEKSYIPFTEQRER